MLEYALGRGIGAPTSERSSSITHNWEANGYRFQALIYEIVNSLPFQSRRAETATEPTR